MSCFPVVMSVVKNRNLIRRLLLVVFVVSVGLSVVEAVGAAEGGTDAVAVTGKPKKTWKDLFMATMPVGGILLLLSVGGFALIIEHCVNLRQDKLDPPDVLHQLQESMEAGDLERAHEICTARDSFVSRVMKAGLENGGTGDDAIEAAREASSVELFNLNTKISYLSLVGNLGPLLGLLGTVTGMITAFQKIESLKAPTPGDLAEGVYESLVNTTMGLFGAIIFLTAYFIFKNKVAKIALAATNQVAVLLRDRTAEA